MMSFKTQDSLAEQIAQFLSQRIFSSELTPGERIQEMRIASELNVSRGSVREAFLILQQRYLIDIIPRKGAVVSELTEKHLHDLFDVHSMLICHISRHLAKECSVEQRRSLVQTLDLMERYVASEQIEQFLDGLLNFTRMLSDAYGNAYIQSQVNDLLPVLQRAMRLPRQPTSTALAQILRLLHQLSGAIDRRASDIIEDLVTQYNGSLQQFVFSSSEEACLEVD